MQQNGEIHVTDANIRERSAEQRVAVRQAETRPLMTSLWSWLMERLDEISTKSSLATAIHYTLRH